MINIFSVAVVEKLRLINLLHVISKILAIIIIPIGGNYFQKDENLNFRSHDKKFFRQTVVPKMNSNILTTNRIGVVVEVTYRIY